MTDVIAPRAVATWSPSVSRVARVLVPVSAQALIVSSTDARWAETRSQGAARGAPLFELRDQPRPRGAHVHWALPRALTHGSSEGGAVRFPTVPDRWLVMRLSPGADAAHRAVRGWVLAGGDAQASVTELDKWKETGTTARGVINPLTVLGHGDVTWSARFDEVEGRLAFHDPLTDVVAGPLAYLVCGWHSNSSHDPLSAPNARTLSARMELLHSLGWSVAGMDMGGAQGAAVAFRSSARAAGLPVDDPQSDAEAMLSLYHGSVVGLGWPDPASGMLGDVGGTPPADRIRVVIASTIAEALSTLATQNSPIESRIIQTVVSRAESILDAPDARALVDLDLHARTFASFPGGTALETIWQPPTETQPLPPGHPPHPRPGIIGGLMIDAVNAATPSTPAAPVRPPVAGVKFERVDPIRHVAPYEIATANLPSRSLLDAVSAVTPAPAPPAAAEPGRFVQVERPLPRFHAPMNPVLLVQGAGRAFHHGADGRFSTDGMLACRVSGACVTSASIQTGDTRALARGASIVARGVENGSVPMECDALLHELALLDPGSSSALSHASFASTAASMTGLAPPGAPDAGEIERRARQFTVEQTAWWALREPRVDPSPLLARSGLIGVLPSPLAIAPPVRPWTPIYAEWEAEYLPSTEGAADWTLGEVDFSYNRDSTSDPVIVQGRCLLSSGPSSIAAGVVRETRLLAQRVGTATRLPPGHQARFSSDVAGVLNDVLTQLDQSADGISDLVARLDQSDVLAGSLDPFHTGLRGGVPGDGDSVPQNGATPSPFVPLRAGFLRLRRLRLVDGFGQFVDLAGSSDTTLVDPAKITWADSLSDDGHPDRGLLPPRFTSPARLMLRLVDANGSPTDADDAISPVCGFILPNHLESSIEVFDSAGGALGIVRHEDDLLWEPAPGMVGIAGRSPDRTIPNPFRGGMVQGLLDHHPADESGQRDEGVLSAFLRAVDSTSWSIDPFAHAGDEHLSLLLGHPIAVIRARMWLEVREPVVPDLSGRPLPVRIGSLAQWNDGVFGYFVDDDYRQLHLPDGAAARFARELGPGQGFLQRIDRVPPWFSTFAGDLAGSAATGRDPVTHPVVNASDALWILPRQVVRLTLLVDPHATVHATTGYLPQKSIGMRRRWMAPGLARIAPTFRFGPLLVDPNSVKMPVARDIGGTWSWVSRSAPGMWNAAEVSNTPGDGAIPVDRPQATEGWLRLVPDPGAAENGGEA